MDHAARRPQGREGGGSQLGQFFEKKLGTIAARQRGGDIEAKGQLAAGAFHGENFQRHLAAADRFDPGGILMAVAVEQTNGGAGTKTANHGEMMRLGPWTSTGPGLSSQLT